MGALIEIRDLVREYVIGGQIIRALDGVDLTVEQGNSWPLWARPVPANRRR
ncbi:hypothetical protein GCM10025859_39070 [Alicyclobacillus fastidiosus]|nr:hypothetical protein GCM10025859_39070 [Alicyclobacillus fastidiosus]